MFQHYIHKTYLKQELVYRNKLKNGQKKTGTTELEILENWLGTENPTIEKGYFEDNKTWTDNADTEEATVTLYKSSVNKYGGFYIARYEAGSAKQRKSSSENGDTVLSQANKYPFNWINRTNSITKAKEIASGKTSVTAGLINGAAWDRTLNWILETNNDMSLADINEDSTSWGNFWDSKFNFTGKYSRDNGDNFIEATTSTEKPENKKYLLETGVTDYTKKNNIYDLAGNCDEWTTESYSSDGRVFRGRLLQRLWFQLSSILSQRLFRSSRQTIQHFFPFYTLHSAVSLQVIQ